MSAWHLGSFFQNRLDIVDFDGSLRSWDTWLRTSPGRVMMVVVVMRRWLDMMMVYSLTGARVSLTRLLSVDWARSGWNRSLFVWLVMMMVVVMMAVLLADSMRLDMG